MNLLDKHKFQIISLILFAFIFYNGCRTTDVGRVIGDEIANVSVDSVYYAVTLNNDTINFNNASPQIFTYDDTYDADITYKVNDSTGQNKLTKKINSDSLKFIYAKYRYVSGWNVLAGVGIVIGVLAVTLFSLLLLTWRAH